MIVPQLQHTMPWLHDVIKTLGQSASLQIDFARTNERTSSVGDINSLLEEVWKGEPGFIPSFAFCFAVFYANTMLLRDWNVPVTERSGYLHAVVLVFVQKKRSSIGSFVHPRICSDQENLPDTLAFLFHSFTL